MIDAAVTWHSPERESSVHTECDYFSAHQGVLRFRFHSGWARQGRLTISSSFQDPETVHPAVYAVIVVGSVIGFTVVCVIACLCRSELASR